MDTVTTSGSRIVGRTSFDFVAAKFFGSNTVTVNPVSAATAAATGGNWSQEHLRSHHPQAPGHDHRP